MKTEIIKMRVQEDLKEFITEYAESRHTTVTRILTKHILSLRRVEQLRQARIRKAENKNAPLE